MYHWETGKMTDAMIFKSGDLPDWKYVSESLMPRVIGCTYVHVLWERFICVQRVVAMTTLFYIERKAYFIRRKHNMNFNRSKRITSWLLCMMLIVAMALSTVGCDTNNPNSGGQASTTAQETGEDKITILGEGETQFAVIVVDKDGNETAFEIHTDKEIVGEALLEVDLIAGEEGPYGLYIKEVNGITADYDVDQTYWAFYVNGEYATSGADTTAIEEGATYSFKVEK